jgi:bisphosphoglycerate-independent phosphoglycerate mutase (AlkP superfamily)
LIVVSKTWKLSDVSNAGLIDVAPSILQILGIKKPKVMSGRSIIQRSE